MDRTGRDNAELDGVLGCEQWEAMLADRMDRLAAGEPELLSAEAEAVFAAHAQRCPGCGELLEQARRGQQWLQLLSKTQTVPPVDLLPKILERTRGAAAEADFPIGHSALAGVPGTISGVRWSMASLPLLPQGGIALLAMRRAHNARLLMTAAMAFFSVALTLSVAGVKITSVHAAELRPQVMQANVTRSFYGTKKQIVSFYENLRLVYEVESKMQDLRRDVEPASTSKPQQAPAPKVKGSAAITPASPGPASSKGADKPVPVVRGWPELVRYPASGRAISPSSGEKTRTTLVPGALRTERNRI